MATEPIWQAHGVMAPQDRSAVAFAPWFPDAQEQPKTEFNDWDLEREAALEQARLAALAAAEAAAAAAQAEPPTQTPAPAAVHTQQVSDADLAQLRAQAHAQGVAEGREAARAEMAQERAQQAALLKEMLNQWAGFRANTAAWFEPLKRLSLAVGEQLARAQLTLNPADVQHLLAHCAQALGESRDQVLVHVNPDDLARLQVLDVRWPADWQWVPDARLGVGSVRLSTQETEVEDLMNHRLSVLAQQLFEPHLPTVDPDHAPEPAPVAGPEAAARELEAEAASGLEAAQAVLPRDAAPSMRERAAQAEAVQDVHALEADPPAADGPAA